MYSEYYSFFYAGSSVKNAKGNFDKYKLYKRKEGALAIEYFQTN